MKFSTYLKYFSKKNIKLNKKKKEKKKKKKKKKNN